MERVALTVFSTDLWRQRGVAHLLAAETGMVIVPPLRLAEAEVAVVVVDRVDVRAFETLERVAQYSAAHAVLVANDLDDLDVRTAAGLRVVAILPAAGLSGDELVRAVQAAARCELPPEALTPHLARQLSRRGRASDLAPRERDLLRLLAEGCDTTEIAVRLCYSERTVKNIVHGLLSRLHLRNRSHAVAYAMRAGVL